MPNQINRDRSTLDARLASLILCQLLKGPVTRAWLIAETGTSNGPVGRAVAMLRRSGVIIDNSGKGGGVYELRRPEEVRAMMAGAMRLSLGDLIASGGISPALGLGLLIEAGAMCQEAA